MLNAVWLDTFVTLCEEGHFTRAAERLNMTQPGVSQHLRKLESQVGQSLISKDGKCFLPTPAGEALLTTGRRRRAEEVALRAALLEDAADVGEVSIACSGSLALLLYPQVIEMLRFAPKLQIHLEAAPQMRVVEGVLNGEFDLGIADHPNGHPRLEATQIGYDPLCLILPATAAPDPDFDALQALGFIAHPDGFAYADALLGANFPNDYLGHHQLRQRSYVNQIGQIPEPVALGIGYTILPRSGVDSYSKRDRLQVADLPKPIEHELWLIQRKSRVLSARAKLLSQLVRGVISS